MKQPIHIRKPFINSQQAELYQRIQAFSLDAADAHLPFSKRLARDNAWTIEYANSVIDEYKKGVLMMFGLWMAIALLQGSNSGGGGSYRSSGGSYRSGGSSDGGGGDSGCADSGCGGCGGCGD